MGKRGPWIKQYESTCLYCCQKFEHAKKPDQVKYCSVQCKDNFYYLVKRKRPLAISNCANCNKEFEHVMRYTVSCSPRCRSKLRFDKMKLERLNI